MILLAAFIISLGLIAHALITNRGIFDNEVAHHYHQKEIQRLQQAHEVDFAKQQAEIFRKNNKSKPA